MGKGLKLFTVPQVTTPIPGCKGRRVCEEAGTNSPANNVPIAQSWENRCFVVTIITVVFGQLFVSREEPKVSTCYRRNVNVISGLVWTSYTTNDTWHLLALRPDLKERADDTKSSALLFLLLTSNVLLSYALAPTLSNFSIASFILPRAF